MKCFKQHNINFVIVEIEDSYVAKRSSIILSGPVLRYFKNEEILHKADVVLYRDKNMGTKVLKSKDDIHFTPSKIEKLDPIDNRFEILDLYSSRREKEKKEREKKLEEIENEGVCEFCQGRESNYKNNPEWVGSMTAYHWDMDKEPLNDPNRKNFLCSDCAEENHLYWQERWDEYNASRW